MSPSEKRKAAAYDWHKHVKKPRLERSAAEQAVDSSSSASSSSSSVQSTPSPACSMSHRTSYFDAPQPDLHFAPCTGVTWNSSYPDHDSWTFQRMMGNPDTLISCILVSYYANARWLSSMIPAHVPVRIVSHSSHNNKDVHPATYDIKDLDNFTWTVPAFSRKSAKGCAHIKLFIFFHQSHTRIVISSANLFRHSFEVLENVLWCADFLPTDHPRPSPILVKLKQTFDILGVEDGLWEPLNRADFSHVDRNTRLILTREGVCSIASIDDRLKYGAPALGKALRELGFGAASSERVLIQFQSSSTGEYDEAWLNWFHSHVSNLPRQICTSAIDDICLIYPSQKEVNNSIHRGEYASGNCQLRDWINPNSRMPIIVREAKCKRKGIICHTKLLTALVTNSKDEGKRRPRAAVCLGSHNFTKAAFGRPYTDDSRHAMPRIESMNLELSVVFTISAKNTTQAEQALESIRPYETPLVKYCQSDVPLMKGDAAHKRERAQRYATGATE